jgi:hypothetical protein
MNSGGSWQNLYFCMLAIDPVPEAYEVETSDFEISGKSDYLKLGGLFRIADKALKFSPVRYKLLN